MYQDFMSELKDFIEDYDIECIERCNGIPLEQMPEAYPDSECMAFGSDEAMGTVNIILFTGLVIRDCIEAYKELDRLNMETLICKLFTAEVFRHGIKRREIVVAADVFDYADSFNDVLAVSSMVEDTYEGIRPWLLEISVNGESLQRRAPADKENKEGEVPESGGGDEAL